jgi:cation diffusion facilitator CzcD-associated flavoprotein CzcO
MSKSSSTTGDVVSSAPSSTNTPPSTDGEYHPSNAAAMAAMQIQQKYAEERAKRLRADGVEQYIILNNSDKFKHFQADPWIDPHAAVGAPALEDGSRCKALILGAGFGGLLFAVRLIQAGIDADGIRLVDTAGGFGGTWYWNRYPGLMCDVESYVYMPLLEEMDYMPKHKYAYGPELREYAESIAEKWELKDKTLFQMGVSSLTWDDEEKEWVVKLAPEGKGDGKGDITVRSQFVISASGVLNQPKLAGLPGMENFQGHSFHTSRWDYAYTGGSPTDPSLTNLKDKRVGILGTGATAVQAVPHLAKWAKELYVFQRTPSAVDIRDNRPTDPEWYAREVQGKKGWQRERMENFNAHMTNTTSPPEIDMVSDGWTKMRSYGGLIGTTAKVTMENVPAHVGTLHALDFPRQERVRARVDEIVKDKTTAQKLKAWYPSWCKRPCFHDDYLPAFNRPNVTLVDTDGKGVDKITEAGIEVSNTEYALDLLIYSTGYRPPGIGSPAFRAGMKVFGRGGVSLDEKWAANVSTLHGVIRRDFPNFFYPGPSQAGATANQVFILDNLSTHVAYIISESAKTQGPGPKDRITIEPTQEAEEEWAMQILSRAASFAGLAGCTPSYINREGEMDQIKGMEEQMKAARAAIWGQGVADYVSVIEGWRSEGGLKGLEVKAES